MKIIFSLLALKIKCKKGKISTHAYPDQKKVLDTNPVSCGYKGEDMDVHRITAQSGQNNYPCGTCVRIKAKGKKVDVVVVDKGGVNFDLSTTAFNKLFGEKTGIHEATWDKIASSNCKGVIKKGGHKGDAKAGNNKKEEGNNKKETDKNKESNNKNEKVANNKKDDDGNKVKNKKNESNSKKKNENSTDGGENESGDKPSDKKNKPKRKRKSGLKGFFAKLFTLFRN